MIPLISTDQMRALEKETITKVGIPGVVLMENAGRSVVERLFELESKGRLHLDEAQVFVIVGPGNNGGDGMIVARYLHNRGVPTVVILCAVPEQLQSDAAIQYKTINACGVPIWLWSSEDAELIIQQLGDLKPKDVIVDALFGTGLTRPLSGDLSRLVQAANDSLAFILAVDVPSGLDADRGLPLSTDHTAEPIVVQADETVTFGFPKLGLCGSPGFIYTGDLTIADIGIPNFLRESLVLDTYLLDTDCLEVLWEPLNPLSHKGSHGHLLVIAGSHGKSGAGLLAARGALAAGVGLCTLACPEEVESITAGRIPEMMTASYPDFKNQQKNWVEEVTEALLPLLTNKKAWVIGPGIPTLEEMQIVLWNLLSQGQAPVVLDADALNLIALGSLARLQAVAKERVVVLTPHPGEAARLLQTSIPEIQANRYEAAKQLVTETGAIVVLKGPRTLIAAKHLNRPKKDETIISVCPTGNAAMGTGGMGDVLAGMIGALIARGVNPYEAACAAVFWHGATGDFLEKQTVKGTLLQASELCDNLRSCLENICHF